MLTDSILFMLRQLDTQPGKPEPWPARPPPPLYTNAYTSCFNPFQVTTSIQKMAQVPVVCEDKLRLCEPWNGPTRSLYMCGCLPVCAHLAHRSRQEASIYNTSKAVFTYLSTTASVPWLPLMWWIYWLYPGLFDRRNWADWHLPHTERSQMANSDQIIKQNQNQKTGKIIHPNKQKWWLIPPC